MMTAITEKYEIRVLEGPQKGSRQVLNTSQVHTIGNSFNSDVYLYDENDAVQQLEILPGRRSLSAKLLSGQAVLDNKPMVVGQQNKLGVDTPVRIGDSLFLVAVVAKKEMSQKNSSLSIQTEPEAVKVPVDETERSSTTRDARGPIESNLLARSKLWRAVFSRVDRPAFLVLFIGCGVLGSAVAAWSSTPLANQSVVKLEEKNEYSNSEIKLIRSSAIVDQHEVNPVVQQASSSDLKKSVLNVFRTHGFKVEVEGASPGKVIVRANTSDTDNLARAKSAALSDVYGLLSLEVKNNPPAVEPVVPRAKSVPVKPGEKITSVVVGNPSYVVTADKSYFFVGAKLSTGHKITSIKKDKITLTKNGETTELIL